MDCSTIIVSYNTFSFTRDAVASVLETAAELDHEVIVVDNNSPDRSADRLREAFPESTHPNVHILFNPDNAGFSRANNQGAAIARGDVLFFLNPDTLVHGTALADLCTFLREHPEAGAVGPHVMNEDGTDQASVASFTTPFRLVRHYLPFLALFASQLRRDDHHPTATQPVDIVKGCALAMRRDVFDRVGGWDESYFMYSEERELCFATRRAGYTNYFVHHAHITHFGGVSSRSQYVEQMLIQQRSALNYLRRHHSTPTLILNRMLGILGYGSRALLFPVAAALRPAAASDYKLRGKAAQRLFRWFMFEYS